MKDLFKSISRSEWFFVALLCLVIMIITTLPYLIGYWRTPPGMVYTGLHALSPGDIPVYYSYINQAKTGQYFFKDLFTSEPQNLGTFNIWWAGVGVLTRIFNWSVIFSFQLARILMIPIFYFCAYLFISYFLVSPKQRKVCLVFLSLASGLGFYVAGADVLLNFPDTVSYRWPIDLWLTESNTFNTLYQTSHFIASIIFMMAIFLLMILAFEKSRFSYAIISGVLALVYFNFHPYYLPVIYGVLGLYLFWLIILARKILWVKVGYWLILVIVSLPSAFYHFWLIKNNPVIAQRALQNITLVSPFLFVLIGYGFLWLGLILALYFISQNKKWNNGLVFLLLWLLFSSFLIFSPLPFQSRYTQGLHLVLVIFTTLGLFEFYDYLKQKLSAKTFDFWVNNPALIFLLFLILFLPSNLYSVTRDLYLFLKQPLNVQDKIYLPQDVLAALTWFKDQGSGKVILAAEIPAKFLPGFSGQTAFLAHGHETLFFESKVEYFLWFIHDNKNDEAKKAFLKKQNIDYFFYSEYEKKMGQFDPATKDYLKLVFSLPQAEIYQVIKN